MSAIIWRLLYVSPTAPVDLAFYVTLKYSRFLIIRPPPPTAHHHRPPQPHTTHHYHPPATPSPNVIVATYAIFALAPSCLVGPRRVASNGLFGLKYKFMLVRGIFCAEARQVSASMRGISRPIPNRRFPPASLPPYLLRSLRFYP